jgi:hypothetical protein
MEILVKVSLLVVPATYGDATLHLIKFRATYLSGVEQNNLLQEIAKVPNEFLQKKSSNGFF